MTYLSIILEGFDHSVELLYTENHKIACIIDGDFKMINDYELQTLIFIYKLTGLKRRSLDA